MEVDLPLLVLALLSASVLGMRALRTRPIAKDWVAVSAVTITVAGLSYLFVPAHVGKITFALWFVLGWAPLLLGRAIGRATLRQHGRLSRALGWSMFVLHPTRAMRFQAMRLDIIGFELEGRTDDALAAIDRSIAWASASPGSNKGSAPEELLWEHFIGLRLQERWDDLDAAIDLVPPGVVQRQPSLFILLLRYDFELGRRGRGLERFVRHASILQAQGLGQARDTVALMLFAFTGRRADVEGLFDAQLAAMSKAMQALWLATADLVAGVPGALDRVASFARPELHSIARSARMRTLFHERYADDPPNAAQTALIDALARAAERDRRYRYGGSAASPPWVTYAIAISLVAVFAAEELLGGSTDITVLDDMGALYAPYVIELHEYHRLVTFLFLHYGAMHATFNLLGLLVLAPFVERALGKVRFAIVYLAAGIAGGLLAVARDVWLATEPSALVGASGSIMGMVGASCAVLLLGYRHDRSAMAKRRAGMLLGLIALQTLFDFLIPNVSQLAHLTGAATGFVVTFVLAPRPTSKRS